MKSLEKRTPWMKFYGADWRANAQLRMCSLAARGLWIEMMCLAHDAEPYGHVLIAGKVPTTAQLAMQVAASPREVERLIAELEAADVFERSAIGAIVSRRMVRDRTKAERDAQNGKEGGNPRLKGGVNPKDNPTDKGGVKAQMPEARSQKEEPVSDSEIHPANAVGARSAPNTAKATRIPPDWTPDEGLTAFAAGLGFDPDRIATIAATFRDYWIAKAGAGGRKHDWAATWRNWCRREAEGKPNDGTSGQRGQSRGQAARAVQLAAALGSIGRGSGG